MTFGNEPSSSPAAWWLGMDGGVAGRRLRFRRLSHGGGNLGTGEVAERTGL